MLILQETQVEPCRVVKRKAGKLHAFPGVMYNNKLFRRLKQFPGPDVSGALSMARRIHRETSGKYLVLVVAEEVIHSVWGEERGLFRTTTELVPENDPIYQLELEELVSRMRDVNGVLIKDRRYKLKTYPRCFLGTEAQAWLMENFGLPAEGALRLGQRLIDERWIHHVTHEHDFEDAELFYRFYWDDE